MQGVDALPQRRGQLLVMEAQTRQASGEHTVGCEIRGYLRRQAEPSNADGVAVLISEAKRTLQDFVGVVPAFNYRSEVEDDWDTSRGQPTQVGDAMARRYGFGFPRQERKTDENDRSDVSQPGETRSKPIVDVQLRRQPERVSQSALLE